MKRILLILAACACACARAGVASARLGSLGRNDSVVTNVTDVTPGNYEAVSNAAMSARGKTDLEVYAADTTPWTCSEVFASGDYSTMTNKSLWTFTTFEHDGEIYPTISYNGVVIGNCNSPIQEEDLPTESSWGMYFDENLMIGFTRYIAGMATGNRLATTNDIPRTPGAVDAYPAASGSALELGKQDALPYPTNAIPFSAIDGAPSSGGQEWREVNYDAEVDVINYVTNGIAILTFINAGYAYGISVSTNGWPEGASMFVRGSFRAGATYTIPYDLRLIGYGTWPTNNFQSVWWRSGTNIYVNVILEE